MWLLLLFGLNVQLLGKGRKEVHPRLGWREARWWAKTTLWLSLPVKTDIPPHLVYTQSRQIRTICTHILTQQVYEGKHHRHPGWEVSLCAKIGFNCDWWDLTFCHVHSPYISTTWLYSSDKLFTSWLNKCLKIGTYFACTEAILLVKTGILLQLVDSISPSKIFLIPPYHIIRLWGKKPQPFRKWALHFARTPQAPWCFHKHCLPHSNTTWDLLLLSDMTYTFICLLIYLLAFEPYILRYKRCTKVNPLTTVNH